MTHVTDPLQLAPFLKRRIEPVGKIPGLLRADGEPAELSVRELNAFEHGEHAASLRDEWGQQTAKTAKHAELKWLGRILCDSAGNPLWQDINAAVTQLGQYPKYIIDLLIVAAAKVNVAPEADAEDKAVASAEKNSEKTQSGGE